MQNRTGAKMIVGSRHDMAKVGRQGMAKKAVAGKHSRQMNWPAQALKQTQLTDDPTGTGLAVKTASR